MKYFEELRQKMFDRFKFDFGANIYIEVEDYLELPEIYSEVCEEISIFKLISFGDEENFEFYFYRKFLKSILKNLKKENLDFLDLCLEGKYGFLYEGVERLTLEKYFSLKQAAIIMLEEMNKFYEKEYGEI